MGDSPGPRLRLTVLGCSTAAPHRATPSAGYLVQWGDTNLLLDAGQGVIRSLQRILDPQALTAVVIGHMHADHYLNLVGLRYLYPWGEPARQPLPVHLPVGGRARLDALAVAVSERAGFFDAAFDAVEYDPAVELTIGDLRVRFVEGQHYVPAWGVLVEAPDGARLAYTGDTGPSSSVEEAVRGADLLLVESSIVTPRDDDPERGHLTAGEAIALAAAAEVRSALLVHYDPGRRAELQALCATAGSWVRPAIDDLTVTVSPVAAGRSAADGSSAMGHARHPDAEPAPTQA
jgi:ribonuclease BN (tRNA processing enzyme)